MAKLVDPASPGAWCSDAAEPATRARSGSPSRQGLGWLDAYEDAVTGPRPGSAEVIGLEVATVAQLGLEVYAI